MTAGNSESLKPTQTPEIPSPGFRRVKIFYHGMHLDTTGLLKEYGLLGQAKRATVSSMVEQSYYYGGIVSIWYPTRGDLGGRSHLIKHLKRELPEGIKSALLENMDKHDISPVTQHKLKTATRYLPPDRLGAVIEPSSESIEAFTKLLDTDGLNLFANNKALLLRASKDVLDNSTLMYLKDTLSIEQLTYDMVTGDIERQLLYAGHTLQTSVILASSRPDALPQWAWSWFEKLNGITFQEPQYEEYRRRLLEKYNRALAKL